VTTIPGFSDPGARKLLSGWFWTWALRRADRIAANPKSTAAFLQAVDGIALRVAFIDTVLAEVALPQVVILGAGLDTRAWRLPVLRAARMFEVDHPSTQGYKRARVPLLGPSQGALTFVPVDFTKDDLEAALAAAGHDAAVPTAWVWEGVTMYLDDAALRGTLAAVRRRSAPGSTLIAHYHEPEAKVRARWLRRLIFGWLGEPQIGMRTRVTMRAEVESAGFRVVEDAGVAAYAARTGGVESAHPRARVSRMVVATVGEGR
jgi:methyltransferase (TIGR00027 family)